MRVAVYKLHQYLLCETKVHNKDPVLALLKSHHTLVEHSTIRSKAQMLTKSIYVQLHV